MSVVVASFRPRPILEECLESLLPQCVGPDVELIVARAGEAPEMAELARKYPAIRLVPLPIGSDLPRLRGAGLQMAAGRMAALTEDHCVAARDWVETLSRYVDGPLDVVGGGMDNARQDRALDWGAFFSEYGFYGSVGPRSAPQNGTTLLLTCANVAYSRRILPDVAAWMQNGDWENVVHDRLRMHGATMAFEPAARVGQNLRYSFVSFCVERYAHGHQYARARLVESPGMNRFVRAGATILLPPLLTWRVARISAGSPARAREFARALPFTMAFLSAWAAGEAAGYLRGPLHAPARDHATRAQSSKSAS